MHLIRKYREMKTKQNNNKNQKNPQNSPECKRSLRLKLPKETTTNTVKETYMPNSEEICGKRWKIS